MAVNDVECQTEPRPEAIPNDQYLKMNASLSKKFQSSLSQCETVQKENEELEDEIQRLKADFSKRERDLQVQKLS